MKVINHLAENIFPRCSSCFTIKSCYSRTTSRTTPDPRFRQQLSIRSIQTRLILCFPQQIVPLLRRFHSLTSQFESRNSTTIIPLAVLLIVEIYLSTSTLCLSALSSLLVEPLIATVPKLVLFGTYPHPLILTLTLSPSELEERCHQ